MIASTPTNDKRTKFPRAFATKTATATSTSPLPTAKHSNESLFQSTLLAQQSNHEIQREILLLQKERLFKQNEFEEIDLLKKRQLAAIEIENAKDEQDKRRAMDEIEKNKQRDAAAIELDRLKRLADLDVKAKEYEINEKKK